MPSQTSALDFALSRDEQATSLSSFFLAQWSWVHTNGRCPYACETSRVTLTGNRWLTMATGIDPVVMSRVRSSPHMLPKYDFPFAGQNLKLINIKIGTKTSQVTGDGNTQIAFTLIYFFQQPPAAKPFPMHPFLGLARSSKYGPCSSRSLIVKTKPRILIAEHRDRVSISGLGFRV